jgi:hypothetical protein
MTEFSSIPDVKAVYIAAATSFDIATRLLLGGTAETAPLPDGIDDRALDWRWCILLRCCRAALAARWWKRTRKIATVIATGLLTTGWYEAIRPEASTLKNQITRDLSGPWCD